MFFREPNSISIMKNIKKSSILPVTLVLIRELEHEIKSKIQIHVLPLFKVIDWISYYEENECPRKRDDKPNQYAKLSSDDWLNDA